MSKIKDTNVLVSVLMMAYNHEGYIEKAIKSIVTQECDFSFELIIGEDYSTDNTRQIVREYAKKYPEIVKPIFRDKNVGIKQNSKEISAKSKGKYLAFCEGDDYWIGTRKLQKQVNLIQNDKSLKAVYTQVKWIDKDDKEIGQSDNSFGTLDYKQLLQINPVHTCSLLIDRSISTENILKIRSKAPYGDYVGFLAAGFYGKIGFVNEIFAAYRRDVGVMHKWSASESGLKRLNIFNLFEECSEFKEMNFYIKIAKQYLCIQLSRHFSDEQRYMQSMKYFVLGLYYSAYVLVAEKEEMYRTVSLSEIIKTGVFSFPYTKRIYKSFRGVKK